MKRLVKNILLSFVIVLSIIFINMGVSALSADTSYININNSESLEVENLIFSNLKFIDYSLNSTQSFGITGTITNNDNNNINYNSIVYYYDKNYNLIANSSKENIALVGTNTFTQMSNLTLLEGHTIEEIYYYSLSVTINNNNEMNIIPSKSSNYNRLSYVIDKYDINIIVNENNTFDITENITAYFNTPKHGIYRTIPLKNTITRLDGTTSTNIAQIKNLSVNNEYKTYKENNNYKIQIGSASRTLTGEQTYTIKYKYNIGKDSVANYDELYYNLIGTEWDTVIGNITFNITMPKEFDESKLGFSSGISGSTNNDNIIYNIEGNKIVGSYNGVLNSGEALTLRLELPEGYFVNAGLDVNYIDYLMFFLPILFLIISIFLWYKYGRDNKVVETVEFYPPKELNSLEVGFLYKGKAYNEDVISLLIYLANKGYIKISEIEEKTLFSKFKSFKITKLKEYDGNNINEKLFLEGLFKKKTTFNSLFNKNKENENNNVNEVTSSDLYDNFYTTMNKILTNVNNEKNKNKIFEKSSTNKNVFIILMIITSYLLITIPPMFNYGNSGDLFIALLFPGIGFTVLFSMVFGKTKIVTKLFGLFWGSLFGGIPWLFIVFPTLLENPVYLMGYIVGLICIVGMVICLKYLPKRSQYGNEMLGKIKGFKNYLETVEKDKLENMVMQDPSYFYNILPYTYVLGVSDKWIKKFEAISLQAPDWYDCPNGFDATNFGSFIKTTMSSAKNVMSSSSSSSSSGSSSGGGFSGGGSGGGGGGSW